MTGFMLKDFYLLRKTFPILFVTAVVIGFSLTFITGGYVIAIIMSAMLSMVEVTTINIDKNVAWNRLSVTMVENRNEIIESKYIMYLLLDVIGAVVGIAIAELLMLKGNGNEGLLGVFIISVSLPLVAGSINIPGAIFLKPEISMVIMLIAYAMAGGVLVLPAYVSNLSMQTHIIGYSLYIFVTSILLYVVSLIITTKVYKNHDIQ